MSVELYRANADAPVRFVVRRGRDWLGRDTFRVVDMESGAVIDAYGTWAEAERWAGRLNFVVRDQGDEE